MNINKININQTEPTYYIASDIYDVSAHNDGVTFPSLTALLSADNLSTLIPSEIRCGGMSIRFIQSSDNKYVQYRLMSTAWSATVGDWERIAGITTIPMSLYSANEYYDWSNVEIGTYIGFNGNPIVGNHPYTFYNYHLYLRKGDKVKIKGKGSTGTSLLYVLVSIVTGSVTYMAEKAYDASVTPVELEIDEDCELYGTSLIGGDYYIIVIHNNNAENAVIPSDRIVGSLDKNSIPYSKLDASTINNFEYAELLYGKPELDTSEHTFTVKAGTMIISNRTSVRQLTLSKDIVFNMTSNYTSLYCVLNTSTLETRVIEASNYLIINNNETVLALVRFNDRVFKGLFANYLLNGKNIALIPNIDYLASNYTVFFETDLNRYIKEFYIEGLDEDTDYCMRTLRWNDTVNAIQLNIGDSTNSVI